MTEPGQGQFQVPAPFVTHESMSAVHQSIGELRQGQASIMSTYNHLRGDMLNGFDKVDKSIATLVAALENQRQQPQPEPRGISLTIRETIIAVVAIMLGTAFLTDRLSDRSAGAIDMRRVVDQVTQ